MASEKKIIRKLFPNLGSTDFKVTSAQDVQYNCIAHAADESHRFWDPTQPPPYFWPDGVSRTLTLESYIAAYATKGYEVSSTLDAEEGYEKVVLYVDANGVPTHAAKLLPSGRWTSKLGEEWDIEHKTLHGLSGKHYGTPKQGLRRAKAKAKVG